MGREVVEARLRVQAVESVCSRRVLAPLLTCLSVHQLLTEFLYARNWNRHFTEQAPVHVEFSFQRVARRLMINIEAHT